MPIHLRPDSRQQTSSGGAPDAPQSLEEDCEELIDAGEHVVSVVTGRARGRASGLEGEFPLAAVWTIREGKIVRMVWFPTRGEALKPWGSGSSAWSRRG